MSSISCPGLPRTGQFTALRRYHFRARLCLALSLNAVRYQGRMLGGQWALLIFDVIGGGALIAAAIALWHRARPHRKHRL